MNDTLTYADLDGKIYNPDCCHNLEVASMQQSIQMHGLARGHYPGRRLLNNQLSTIKSIGYWNATKKQSWDLDWHCNEGIEICFLEAGSLDFFVDGNAHQLKANTLTITRPWLPHRIGQVGLSKLHWFIIDVDVRLPHQTWKWPGWISLNPADLAELTNILQRNEQSVWMANAGIKDCFVKIAKTVQNEEEHYFDSKLKVYINEILILILELFKSQTLVLNEELVSSKRSVQLFLSTLEAYISQPLSLERMAGYCGLGVTQFSKHCLELTNRSPIHYLNDLRMSEACKQLISMPDKTITDIAYDCGFTTNQYFSHVFKLRLGMSPRKYRRDGLKNR